MENSGLLVLKRTLPRLNLRLRPSSEAEESIANFPNRQPKPCSLSYNLELFLENSTPKYYKLDILDCKLPCAGSIDRPKVFPEVSQFRRDAAGTCPLLFSSTFVQSTAAGRLGQQSNSSGQSDNILHGQSLAIALVRRSFGPERGVVIIVP